MFEITAIPAFRDNYIWLLQRDGDALVVDPGDARPVIALLERRGLRLKAILVTHHHADHQGGIGPLTERWQPEVYAPAAESITGRTHPLRGGERLSFAWLDAGFEVLPVPGHTLGHLAFYGAGRLFCGDTLFGGGCGRLFEGTPAQMLASLDALATLPGETAVHCAHEYTEANLRFALAVEPGNEALQRRITEVSDRREQGLPTVPSTIALEKATNPFLRCDQLEIITSVSAHTGGARDRLSVFAALREWKNSF